MCVCRSTWALSSYLKSTVGVFSADTPSFCFSHSLSLRPLRLCWPYWISPPTPLSLIQSALILLLFFLYWSPLSFNFFLPLSHFWNNCICWQVFISLFTQLILLVSPTTTHTHTSSVIMGFFWHYLDDLVMVYSWPRCFDPNLPSWTCSECMIISPSMICGCFEMLSVT